MPDYTQISYNGFALDDLGEISVMSQSGRMVPDKLAQKEIRQLRIRIDVFQQDYDTNYNLIQQARDALESQNKVMEWKSPGVILTGGQSAGSTEQLNRPVVIVSHDIPEDPNSWGTYNQQINIVIEFEVDLTDATVHMAATFQQTGAAGQPTNLGQIVEFNQGYRATKYSDLRNIRDRASGTVTLKGELFVGLTELAGSEDIRRQTLYGMLQSFMAQVDGKDGVLQYGLQGSTTFFNQSVRISAFEARINQALNGIEWTMTADWTEFPNEASYAAADFRVERSEDRETGEKIIRLTGNIGAPTPTVANAKLTLLMQTVLFNAKMSDGDAGWATLAPIRFSTNPRYINTDDTQSLSTPVADQQMGTPTSNDVFLFMDFSIEWRKKSANLQSWKLTINTQDDAATGMQRITFSGSVICSGATADSAWSAAIAQARLLGDKKYPFRMSYTEARHDRYIDAEGTPPTSFNTVIGLGTGSTVGYSGAGIQEFVECAFTYEYRTKGVRIYLEAKADKTVSTFGENGLRVSGFVAAPDQSTAMSAYQSQVKAAYLPNLVLDEETSTSTDTIQTGAQWGQASGYGSLFVRFDFNLRIWMPKASGQFAIQFGLKSDIDYVSLKRSISVDGTYWDTQANIVAATTVGGSSPLDTFLAQLFAKFSGATKLSDSRSESHDYLSGSNDSQMGLRFSQNYVQVITNPAQQILETTVNEAIQYSGVRNREFSTPLGPSVIQQLGVTTGSRTVSGTVTAATETAALAWIATQRGMSFPVGPAGAVSKPSTRYLQPPQITREFVFLPLTANPTARGNGLNIQLVKMSFTFSELMVNSRYVDANGTV